MSAVKFFARIVRQHSILHCDSKRIRLPTACLSGYKSTQGSAPRRGNSRFAGFSVLLLSFAALLLGAADANALTCTSVANTSWNLASTWTSAGNCNRVPTIADDVIIAGGTTVTMTAPSANVLSII